MIVLITIGMWLLGITLGVVAGFLALRGRAVKPVLSWLVGGTLAVVTAALLHFVVTPRVADAWAMQRARAELLAIPVYEVLQREEPAAFGRLLAEYVRVVQDRSRIGVYTQVANSEIGAVATRRIAHASDPALLGLMHDMLGKLQLLRARAPEDCYRYLFPQVAGAPDTARYFDRASQERTLSLMAEVIRSAAENPVPVPGKERVQGLLAPLVDAMYAQFGASTALLSHAEEPGVDRKMVCAVSVALYEKVMALPPADAAAVIRSMTQL